MRKLWLLLGVALLGALLALGAAACGDDDDDGDGDNGDQPTATEVMDEEPTEAMDEEPTEPAVDPGDGAGATLTATGGILTDADGNTLYIFDNDEPDVSTCTEGCLDLWPPLLVEGEATAGEGVTGVVGTIERDDGTTQVTLDSQPLYYFADDEAPGDTNGDGFGGVWHVIAIGG